MAVYGGDDRYRKIGEGPVAALEQLVLADPLGLGHPVTLFQIAPCAKYALSGTGQHNAANVAAVFGQPGPEIELVMPHLGVDGITDFRAIQGDDQYMVIDDFEFERCVLG